jgi:hypothetical protein
MMFFRLRSTTRAMLGGFITSDCAEWADRDMLLSPPARKIGKGHL